MNLEIARTFVLCYSTLMPNRAADREVPPPNQSAKRFGRRLRSWRSQCGLSQMALALESGVSARHLSFLETGRARPSQKMVVRLSQALELPPREQNTLLAAAGFSGIFRETSLEAAEMQTLQRILWTLVERQDPYPAFLLDHCWNVLFANRAVANCLAPFAQDAPVWRERPLNLLRLTLHPDGLRRSLVNWEDVAADALGRARREEAFSDANGDLYALIREFDDDTELSRLAANRAQPSRSDVVLPLHLKTDHLELRLFSTVTTVGSPGELTVEGLRIETFVPVDDATEEALRSLSLPSQRSPSAAPRSSFWKSEGGPRPNHGPEDLARAAPMF